jgi:hypothetical protein
VSDPNVVAGYRRAIARRGQWVILRRISGQAPHAAVFDAMVRAIVMDYRPQSEVMAVKREGGITQGGRNVIVMRDDLAEKRFPLPVKKNDKLILLERDRVNQEQTEIALPDGTLLYESDALNISDPDPNKRGLADAIDFIAGGV